MPITVTIKIENLRRDDKDRSAEHVRDQLLEAVQSPSMTALLAAIMPIPASRANLTQGRFIFFGEAGLDMGGHVPRWPTATITATREAHNENQG